jgi:hypothetical protein
MRKYVSIHIPKCAGSSLRVALKNALGEHMKSDYGNRVVLADLQAIRLRRAKNQDALKKLKRWEDVSLIHGHFYASKYLHAPFEKEWITFVRNPISLILSYYYFLRRKKDGPLADLAKELSADEFVEHPFFSNVITRITYPLQPTEFKFIGFTEVYSESLNALSSMLGAPLKELSRNTNTNGSNYQDTHPELRRKIERFNTLDMEWYENAKARASVLGLPAPD